MFDRILKVGIRHILNWYFLAVLGNPYKGSLITGTEPFFQH